MLRKNFLKKIELSGDLIELFGNSIWSFTGSIISKAFLFFAWLIVAKALGKEGNGEVGIVRSTINLFTIFVGSGIALTTIKFIPELLEKNKEKLNSIISLTFFVSTLLGIILSATLFFGADYLAENVLKAPNLTNVLKIGAFIIFLSALNSVISGCLKGLKDFRSLVIVDVLYGVCMLLLLYLGTRYYGVEGAFWGFGLSSFGMTIIGGGFLYKKMKASEIKFTKSIKNQFPVFKRFTLPAILTGIMVVPFKWGLDTLLVNQENGFEELGLFTAILLVQTLMIMIMTTIDAPMLTVLVKEGVNKKIETLSLLVPWALGIAMVMVLLIYPEFFEIFLGKEYTLDPYYRPTLFLILATTVIMAYKQGIARIMVVNNLMWFSFLSNLLWGLVLLFTFLYVPHKNAVTMALCYLIAYVSNVLFVLPFYVKKGFLPIHLVISIESLMIWILLGGSMCFYYCLENYLFYKILYFILVLPVFFYLFTRLAKKKIDSQIL